MMRYLRRATTKTAVRFVLAAGASAMGGHLALAAGPFDGVWNVHVVCSQAADGAAGYELRFQAQVRDGALVGYYRSQTTEAEMRLTGQIQPNGEALLVADGRTGRIEYSVGRVQPGTPYHYTANARFGPSSGAGTRNELRPCNLAFSRG